MFLTAALIVALAGSLITIKTLVGYSDIRLSTKILTSVLIVLSWTAPLLISFFRDILKADSTLFNVFSALGYTLFGFAFILLVLLVLRDLVWYLIYGTAKLFRADSWSLNPKNLSMLGHANSIVIFAAAAVCFYALFQGLKLPEVNRFTIGSALIKHDVKAVLISDLHLTRLTPVSWVKRIVEEVNRQQPDVVFLTGDIIDDKVPQINEQLNALVELGAPYGIYAVMGNHEFYNGINSWSYKFKQLGFQTLINRGMFINDSNIFISGVPDTQTAANHPYFNINFEKALKGSNLQNYKILLTHNPETVGTLSRINYQLVLAGHTHGGQIYPFHLAVEKANRFLAGMYDVNGIKLYVTRGAGTWGPAMRLLAPSEITVFELQADPGQK